MIGEEETLADHLGPGVGPDHPEETVEEMTEAEIVDVAKGLDALAGEEERRENVVEAETIEMETRKTAPDRTVTMAIMALTTI